jgi:adenosylhomocysteine nucleosidase
MSGIGWAILFALRRESAPFLRRRQTLTNPASAPCPTDLLAAGTDRALVVEMGIGFDRARAAIRWVLDHFEPRLVIIAGFSGALDPALKIGEVVVASEVIEPDDQKWHAVLPMELGDRVCGRLLTARSLIASVAEKRRLFRSTRAVAVDMESAAVAEACQSERIPCAVVRVISDTAESELSPHLVQLFSGGRISPAKAFAALLCRPALATQFWRLARDTRIAAKNLAAALDAFIPA